MPKVETVTVTAARLPSFAGVAAFSASTLDARALARYERLDQVLKQVPGISLFRRTTSDSANATTQGLSLRAIAPSGAGRAVVLLDGVPVNDPFGGWVIWSALPFEDIAAAEIIRGAGAGPYGAGALTGTILLSERATPDGIGASNISGGSLGAARIGVAAGVVGDDGDIFASAALGHSDGWIPVRGPRASAADEPVWLNSAAASLRMQRQTGGMHFAARIAHYDEARGGGLAGVSSMARGWSASVSASGLNEQRDKGWRAQLWIMATDFANRSASVPAFPAPRGGTTPANEQYETPALGFGGNVALLGGNGDFRWQAGADLRAHAGESREYFFFSPAAGDFTMQRRAGGKLTIAGLYGEAAYTPGDWLITAGVRSDYWATASGHLIERNRLSGAQTVNIVHAGRDDIIMTFRAGVKRSFADNQYVRLAGYKGFRPPTLNELYRPFRVGNNSTLANAGLDPETLYGVEAGWGGKADAFHWNVTVFWNVLRDAIANVTQSASPAGIISMRRNAGDIEAGGVEGDMTWRVADNVTFSAAFSYTDAKVRSTQAALNGKRPAQAPAFSIGSGAEWDVSDRFVLRAALRWESARFEDDLNSLKLAPAALLDLNASYDLSETLKAMLSIENVNDADVETALGADGTISYGAPRRFLVQLRYAP